MPYVRVVADVELGLHRPEAVGDPDAQLELPLVLERAAVVAEVGGRSESLARYAPPSTASTWPTSALS
jgi:hypothetical protein